MRRCSICKPGAPINYPYTPDSTITALQVVANITDNSGNVIVSKPLKGYQYDDINNNYWLPDIAAGQTHLLYTENPFTINAGEQLRFSFTFQSYEPFDSTNTSLIHMPIDIDLSVKFTSNPDSEPDYGSITIGASANLFDCMNFDTQGDFVRAVIQTFVLFPVFDYRTKTVTFETFQTVIDNKNAGNVMDWSDKLLQDDELEFSYQPDNFAKINEINFKEENDYQTGWTFRMYSASLEQGPEEYMEIPFASAKI